MRSNHLGLTAFLKKQKIQVQPGDYIVFLNQKRTILKMFCNSDKAILHYKQEHPIDPGVIRYLPQYCNGKEFDMQGAKLKNLEDLMQHKK